MRLLIVSYYFPPAAGGGVQRVLGWSKYLSEFGIEVDVLAPDDPGWLHEGGGLKVPDGVTVHRTRNPSPRAVRPGKELEGQQGLGKVVRTAQLQPRRLLVPDIHVGWYLAARKTAVELIRTRNIRAVLSTSPPRSAHLIGAHVARRTGIPWIADYRDSWLDLPHTRLEQRSVRGKHKLQVRIANRAMRHASLATTVSEPLAADLRKRHPAVPVKVITNGVDFAELADLAPPPALASGGDRSEYFVLTYTGNFFGRQSPRTFLDALEQLLEREPDRARTLRVRFVGSMQPEQEARIVGGALGDVVEHVAFESYAEVLADQHAADALLLYVAPGMGSEGVYTGKVFEYVASRRPVLALTPDGNVAGDLLRRAGTGTIVDPDSVDAIATAIAQLHDAWQRAGRVADADTPEDVLTSISRREQAGQLAGLVHQLGRA
jgi:glycosyltransferase involved in cell wall biosynthesis